MKEKNETRKTRYKKGTIGYHYQVIEEDIGRELTSEERKIIDLMFVPVLQEYAVKDKESMMKTFEEVFDTVKTKLIQEKEKELAELKGELSPSSSIRGE
jgi:hypothetical protein